MTILVGPQQVTCVEKSRMDPTRRNGVNVEVEVVRLLPMLDTDIRKTQVHRIQNSRKN